MHVHTTLILAFIHIHALLSQLFSLPDPLNDAVTAETVSTRSLPWFS